MNEMTYSQSVDYINSFLVFGSKPGLERISNLLNRLGNPEKNLKFIHVAGTNGKGSVCACLSCILQQAGYKTGMFVSPYVMDFAERFQINGENINHEALAKITEQVKTVVDTLSDDEMVTEFELITAIGYMYFAMKKCDVVVLEVGLGGKYDSTNTITPLCSIINSISLDHTAILGNTVEKIAMQKAGIIKQGKITVMYPIQSGDVKSVIESEANAKNNRFIIPDMSQLEILDETAEYNICNYKGLKFKTGMAGKAQPYNAITAIEAIRAVYPNISDDNIVCGLGIARLPARCQIIDKDRPVILDGAHNPDGVLSLKSLLEKYKDTKFTAVIGMMKDKDIDTVLSEMVSCFDKIITVTVNNPRSISADELAEKVKQTQKNSNHKIDVIAAKDVEYAANTAFSTDGAVCICGSFYLMSQIRPFLPYTL